jgi:thiol-disulfide isomerase/thioredoxin
MTARRVAPLFAGLLLALPLAPRAEPVARDSSRTTPRTGVVQLDGLRLPDLDGEPVDLGSYLGGGPLVLDFWATWCKPCLAALPELNALYRDLAPRGLQLVAINEDGQRNAAKVKPFVKTQGFDFPVLVDLNREVQSRLHVVGLPTTFLLDSDGKVVRTSFGYRPGEIDGLRQEIESLLDEPGAR